MKKGQLDPYARRHINSQRYSDDDLSALEQAHPKISDFIRKVAVLVAGCKPDGAKWLAVQADDDCRSCRLCFYDTKPGNGDLPIGSRLVKL